MNEDAFCTICGQEHLGSSGLPRSKRVLAARLLIFGGIAFLVSVLNMMLVRLAGVGLFAGWINSWWNNHSFFRVKIFFMRTYQLGPTVCFWFAVIGVALVVAGVMVYRKKDFDLDIFDFD